MAALANAARRSSRWLPGATGAVLVCAGLWLTWPPLALIAAGGFLLLIDGRSA